MSVVRIEVEPWREERKLESTGASCGAIVPRTTITVKNAPYEARFPVEPGEPAPQLGDRYVVTIEKPA